MVKIPTSLEKHKGKYRVCLSWQKKRYRTFPIARSRRLERTRVGLQEVKEKFNKVIRLVRFSLLTAILFT